MHQFIPRGLSAVESLLGDKPAGPYCHGGEITMADICLLPQIFNANRWGVPLEPYPRIRSIVTAMERVPEVDAAHPRHFRLEQC